MNLDSSSNTTTIQIWIYVLPTWTQRNVLALYVCHLHHGHLGHLHQDHPGRRHHVFGWLGTA